MRTSLVRLLPVGILALAGACSTPEAGEERLEKLTAGITRDSLMAILGEGTLTASGADTMRVDHGHRRMRYFINGQMFEVLYVRDEPGDVREPVAQAIETPVVLSGDQKVLGWGWKFYVEEAMGTMKLPTPLVEVVGPPDSARAATAK